MNPLARWRRRRQLLAEARRLERWAAGCRKGPLTRLAEGVGPGVALGVFGGSLAAAFAAKDPRIRQVGLSVLHALENDGQAQAKELEARAKALREEAASL